MSSALETASQWFNNSVDPAEYIPQRGSYAPFYNGYPAWDFQTSAGNVDKLYFSNDALVIRHPDTTESSYYLSYSPYNTSSLPGEVARDLVQDAQTYRPPAPPPPPAPPVGAAQAAIDRAMQNNMLGVASTRYTVQPGDSYEAIAQRFGTTVPRLREANQITSDPSFGYPSPGWSLIIPDTGAPKQGTFVAEVPITVPNANDGSRYTGRIMNNGWGGQTVTLVRTLPQTGAQIFYNPVSE